MDGCCENQNYSNFYGSPCKNEEDPFKNEGIRVVTTDLPFKSMQIFYNAQGNLTPQSKVCSTLNKTHPSFNGCPCYLQE